MTPGLWTASTIAPSSFFPSPSPPRGGYGLPWPSGRPRLRHRRASPLPLFASDGRSRAPPFPAFPTRPSYSLPLPARETPVRRPPLERARSSSSRAASAASRAPRTPPLHSPPRRAPEGKALAPAPPSFRQNESAAPPSSPRRAAGSPPPRPASRAPHAARTPPPPPPRPRGPEGQGLGAAPPPHRPVHVAPVAAGHLTVAGLPRASPRRPR